jgi:hypothetical protein
MPERYLTDRRVLRLSDSAFRAFVNAMIWAVSNRTDGVIEQHDLTLIPNFVTGHEQDFITAGLWDLHEDGYIIIDFATTQTSRDELEVLENARRADREKKRRQRQAAKTAIPFESPGTSPGRVPGTAQDRTGEERTGKDRQGEDTKTSHLHTVVSPFGNTQTEMQRDAQASWDDVVGQVTA